jgi:hypothetical protein
MTAKNITKKITFGEHGLPIPFFTAAYLHVS